MRKPKSGSASALRSLRYGGRSGARWSYDVTDLGMPPTVVPIFGRDVRALAVSNDETKVFAVVQRSGKHQFLGATRLVYSHLRPPGRHC